MKKTSKFPASHLKPLHQLLERDELLRNQAYFEFHQLNQVLRNSVPRHFRHKIILSHTQDYTWFLLVQDSTTATQIHYLSSEIKKNIFDKLHIRIQLKVHVDPQSWAIFETRRYPRSLWAVKRYSDEDAQSVLNRYIQKVQQIK